MEILIALNVIMMTNFTTIKYSNGNATLVISEYRVIIVNQDLKVSCLLTSICSHSSM